MTIKRADWVTCKDASSTTGIVKRVAKSGLWVAVDWGFHTKRMQTRVLVVQSTITCGSLEITDMTRETELKNA